MMFDFRNSLKFPTLASFLLSSCSLFLLKMKFYLTYDYIHLIAEVTLIYLHNHCVQNKYMKNHFLPMNSVFSCFLSFLINDINYGTC